MIHAYDEQYLSDAMHNLGEAFDFARNVCQIELDTFLSMMISSGVAALFESGTPKYVSGMSGTELVMDVLKKSGIEQEKASVQTEYDCSPEYWTGWIVAYFQWYTGRSFQSICEVLSMREILRLYPTLHEVSEDRAVDTLNNIILKKALPTRLQARRKNCKLTQRKLSEMSGVNIRTIQQYEGRSKDINKAAGATLRSLAQVLSCRIEDLLEYESDRHNAGNNRYIIDHAKYFLVAGSPVHGRSQDQGDGQSDRNTDHVEESITKTLPEKLVIEHVNIVFQADNLGFLNGLSHRPGSEAGVDGHSEGDHDKDQHSDQRNSDQCVSPQRVLLAIVQSTLAQVRCRHALTGCLLHIFRLSFGSEVRPVSSQMPCNEGKEEGG